MTNSSVDSIFEGRVVLQINCSNPSDKHVMFTDDDHSYIREHFLWEQKLDKKGKPLTAPKMLLLKDITDAHLKNLCYCSVNWKDEKLNKVFVSEYNWRIDYDEAV